METKDWVTTVCSIVAMIASGFIAIRLTWRQEFAEKRRFCFELQRQFDSPEMFRCRFYAWKSLENGDFKEIKTVSELLASDKWSFEVSAVLHFFQSLEAYIEQGLLNESLARKLFARPFSIYHDRLLANLEMDAASDYHQRWFSSFSRLHDRFKKFKEVIHEQPDQES